MQDHLMSMARQTAARRSGSVFVIGNLLSGLSRACRATAVRSCVSTTACLAADAIPISLSLSASTNSTSYASDKAFDLSCRLEHYRKMAGRGSTRQYRAAPTRTIPHDSLSRRSARVVSLGVT